MNIERCNIVLQLAFRSSYSLASLACSVPLEVACGSPAAAHGAMGPAVTTSTSATTAEIIKATAAIRSSNANLNVPKYCHTLRCPVKDPFGKKYDPDVICLIHMKAFPSNSLGCGHSNTLTCRRREASMFLTLHETVKQGCQ